MSAIPFIDQTTACASSLLAQAASRSLVDALVEIEIAKLVILLVMGTGVISAAGYAIANIIRAGNGSSDENEELQAQLVALEQRVKTLEDERRL